MPTIGSGRCCLAEAHRSVSEHPGWAPNTPVGWSSKTVGVDIDPRQRRDIFDRVPDIYHRIRPGYPRALFDGLFAVLPPRARVLEVGPGTGQATRDLLARGADVHAVEIGPAMAEKLREVLPAEELRITVGDFERVPSDEASFDCVFSATAYHWPERSSTRRGRSAHAFGATT